ncbi:MAG: RNA 2',3'-cyclic phosphodiesterase [Gemmatimonadota bacterium]
MAVPLPRALRAAYAVTQRALAGPGVRPVQPESLHLTLKFLGSLELVRVERVCEALADVASSAERGLLRAGRVGAFPSARAARVLVVELEDASGSVTRLGRALERALVPLGFSAEERELRLHVTLGRVREGKLDARSALARAPVPAGEWPVDAFALVESRLGGGPPVHRVLRRFAVGEAAPAGPLARGSAQSLRR